jgi:4a-hydroxytetrahydrobiopterin dehydratase
MALLNAEELAAGLATLPDWSGDLGEISRTVDLPSFPVAIAVVDRVAAVAEELEHHPDIDIRWRTLKFSCATHTAGGVTEKDLDLAHRIDKLVATAI